MAGIGMSDPDAAAGAIANSQSSAEWAAYQGMTRALIESPVPHRELIAHLGIYLDRSALAHLLFLDHVYRLILGVHGVVMEFGVRWGRNLAVFTELRNIYEPRNGTRRVIGFDTFSGFPHTSDKDGSEAGVAPGSYSVVPGYVETLRTILGAHEQFGFRPHERKFELVQGDVAHTLPAYLDLHPETVVALAYLDLDLYAGTAAVLTHLRERLVCGSVVVFDELCMRQFPGETQALLETWGLRHLRLQRAPAAQNESYVILD
jgi:Macrocin-O-methyltransferase (TylF)